MQSGPTAFITPFLDASKIKGDTHDILTHALMHKTTAEWEEFIVAAKEEWVEFEARRPLRMVEELLSGGGIGQRKRGVN